MALLSPCANFRGGAPRPRRMAEQAAERAWQEDLDGRVVVALAAGAQAAERAAPPHEDAPLLREHHRVRAPARRLRRHARVTTTSQPRQPCCTQMLLLIQQCPDWQSTVALYCFGGSVSRPKKW